MGPVRGHQHQQREWATAHTFVQAYLDTMCSEKRTRNEAIFIKVTRGKTKQRLVGSADTLGQTEKDK